MGVVCGQLDITQISEDNLIAISGYGAWVRFDVDEKIYEILGFPYGYAVVKFDSPCWTTSCPDDTTAEINNAFLMVSTSLNNSTLKSGIENAAGNSAADLPGSGVASSMFCGVNVSLLKQAQSMVDSLQSNEKSFQPAAVRPNACLIPIKSNVFTYGPWASSNFSTTYGGSEMQVNNDLAPWLFGSISSMNIAGQEIANTSLIGLSAAEKGSVTVPGLPAYSIGAALAAGPNLTNISTNFGSNGATTSYDFSTYTPKFGQVSRAIIEKYKNIVKIRNEQLRFLRQNQILNNKIVAKQNFNRGIAFNNRETSKSISDKNSLSRVLIGEVFDYQTTAASGIGQRTVCGMSSLSKSVLEMRDESYSKKAFMSMDGLYGPISISGDGDLPRFIEFANYTNAPSGISWSVSPNPPSIKSESDTASIINSDNNDINNKLEIISIHKEYLNPLANPGSIPHHDGEVGHCIDIVGRETGLLSNSGLITNFYRPNDDGKYSEDYRFLGMRGPLVLHSWGYDTDGKPVPNAADTDVDTKIGKFTTENLEGKFLEDWLQKPTTWPVAPIDLRLDRERGVWVSPPQHKIIVVKLLDTLNPYSNTSGLIINSNSEVSYNKTLYDNDGNELLADEYNVVVCDRLGHTLDKDDLCYAYFDTYTSQYIVLNGGGESNIKVARTNGSWAKLENKPINIYKIDPLSNKENLKTNPTISDVILDVRATGIYALNISKSIIVSANQEYWCTVFNAGGMYILLDSECGC